MRMRYGGAISALHAWNVFSKERIRLTRAALKVVGRILHARAARAWSAWHHNAQERSRLRNVAQKVLLRWMRQALARALVAWVEHVKEVQRLRNVAQKVLLRWMRQALARALVAWTEHVKEYQRLRNVAQKVLLRWMRQALAMVFTTWHECVLDSQGMTDKTRRAMRRWSEREIIRTFAAWASTTQSARSLRSCAKKVILRMQQAGLCVAFLRWYETHASVSRHVRLLRKAASRFSKPRLSNALHLWYDKVQEGKIELQRDKHLDRVLSRLPSRRWRIQLDSAWCIWARYTYRKRQFGRTALMIRSRRARNALCHAWESISLLYSVKRDSRRAVDKYTLMSNFLNRPRINTGVGVVFIKSFWNWAALSARYRTLFHVAAFISRRETRRMLERSFAELRDVASHNKAALRRILTSWRRTVVKSMRSAFHAWMCFRLHQAKLRYAARVLITREYKMILYEQFRLWLDSAVRSKNEARALAAQVAQNNHKAIRIWMRILNRSGSTAFRLWSQLCERKNKMKAGTEKLHAHLNHRLKCRVLGCWQTYVRANTNLRARLGRVVNCLQGLSGWFVTRALCGGRVRLIMRSWRTFIVDKKYDRKLCDDVIAEWHRNIKTRVFIAMFDYVANSKQARIQQHRAGPAAIEALKRAASGDPVGEQEGSTCSQARRE